MIKKTSSGKSTEFMFSANGKIWHAESLPGDKFFRMKLSGCAWWSEAFELVPEVSRSEKFQNVLKVLT